MDVKTQHVQNRWHMFVNGVVNPIVRWIAHRCRDGSLGTSHTKEKDVERAVERTGPVEGDTCERSPSTPLHRSKTSRHLSNA